MEQNDWIFLLPIAEVTYNNSSTARTGLSPFYANYGFHLTATNSTAGNSFNSTSKVYMYWMHAVYDEARKGLKMVQERMCRYVHPNRKEASVYQVGNLVILNGYNIQTCRPLRKMDHKNHDPFQVEKIVSPLTVRLILPHKWKIYNVFHISLLKPFRTSEYSALPDPSKVLREEDDVEESEEYVVEEIMQCRVSSEGTATTVVFSTLSNGLTSQTDTTERRSHSTTSHLVVWINSRSFINGIPTPHMITGLPKSKSWIPDTHPNVCAVSPYKDPLLGHDERPACWATASNDPTLRADRLSSLHILSCKPCQKWNTRPCTLVRWCNGGRPEARSTRSEFRRASERR
jgi:hypothetical protein